MKPAIDFGQKKTSGGRRASDLTLSKVRSALTNGTSLFSGPVDERGAFARRFKDLLHAYYSDLGGEPFLSEGQKSLVRRASMIEVQLEMQESRWAANSGEAPSDQLLNYQRSANSLRRLLEALELHRGRKLRDVTPPADVTGKVLAHIRSVGQ